MAPWKSKLLTLFLCIYRCCYVTAIFNETNLLTNFLAKGSKFLEENNTISVQCKDHLTEYIQGLRSTDLWALKMFDSGAKFPSGVFQGNWFNLGAFEECLGIEKSLTPNNTIYGKYCIGMMPIDRELLKMVEKNKIQNATQLFGMSALMEAMPEGKIGIQLATCVPDSCSAAEIQELFSKVEPKMVFYDLLCQTQATQDQTTISSIAFMNFLYIYSIIMIISSVYEIIIYYTHSEPIHPLLTAFSIWSNGKKLITTSEDPKRFSCLDGLRVLSMMSILLGHAVGYRGFSPSNNSVDVWNWGSKPSKMYIILAYFALEIFFLITGLLLSYNFLTSVIVKKIQFNIFRYYIHRYLRITPMLVVIIAFQLTLLIQMGSGPLWPITIQICSVYGCAKHWWKVLLYVQNISGPDFWCIPQSWYVCLDMQLFLLSPIILISLKRWPKQALAGIGFLTVCLGIYYFILGWMYKFHISPMNSLQSASSADYNSLYYMAIPGRVGTWLVGIVLGYIIFQTQQRKTSLTISKPLVLFLWATAIATIYACVLTTHQTVYGDYSKLAHSLHFATVRYAWSVAISWIIFACFLGFGGPINSFLSLPLFQIVSKLTFSMYLVQVQVIQFTTAQIRVPTTFGDVAVIHGFLGDFLITVAVAVILTLAVESPMAVIQKLLFTQRKGVKDPKRKL